MHVHVQGPRSKVQGGVRNRVSHITLTTKKPLHVGIVTLYNRSSKIYDLISGSVESFNLFGGYNVQCTVCSF